MRVGAAIAPGLPLLGMESRPNLPHSDTSWTYQGEATVNDMPRTSSVVTAILRSMDEDDVPASAQSIRYCTELLDATGPRSEHLVVSAGPEGDVYVHRNTDEGSAFAVLGQVPPFAVKFVPITLHPIVRMIAMTPRAAAAFLLGDRT